MNELAVNIPGCSAKFPAQPEQNQKLAEETTEVVVDKLVDADKEEVLRQLLAAEDKSGYCRPGWFRHGTRCFLFVRSSQTWNNAETQCVAEQASLASVHNLDEHSFLQNLLRVTGISYAWLGAYNLQGTWRWIDRTRFSYSNWYSLSSVSSYPCVFIRNNAGWSNTNCANRYPFFCSTDPSKC
ncbi:ladderlectin-like [Neoarius graeffei]|uniref:ladderlectin-like n=1 Tax=Neoarius graeffei TaxID=443677 RepID=UPI00298D4FF0|nr:ladderlectin-like [Neoarius graeffei]XP_060780962.1 ladderlectin-like [Neoarius graeffei]